MTVSRSASSFGRGGFFFSGFDSCLTGCLDGISSSVVSLLAILRDERGGARLLVGMSFPVDDSESFEGTGNSLISAISKDNRV